MSKNMVADPWMRFLARNIDFAVYTFVLVMILVVIRVLLGLLGTDLSFLAEMPGVLFSAIYVALLVGMEVLVLYHYETTPGKWFLNIQLNKSDESKMSYNDAFMRTFNVWFRGLGLGIPILSIFTQINAYGHLQDKGITSWDKDGDFNVKQGKTDTWRIALAIFVFVVSTLWYMGMMVG